MGRIVLLLAAALAMLGLVSVTAQESAGPQFRYNRHGQRNPFVPLIIPTATPTQPPTPTATPTPTLRPGELPRSFAPPTPTPTEFVPPPFNLEAILIRPGFALAVINGELVEEGDVFGDAGILLRRIQKNKITLEYQGHRWTHAASSDWRLVEEDERRGAGRDQSSAPAPVKP
ncbi:hypothetical protein HS125_17565 [bacterium]|nr:hypothetical protein [bacterium]